MTDRNPTRTPLNVPGSWRFSLALLALSLVLAFGVAPWASSSPDGLERVAHNQGFLDRGEGPVSWNHAPMPDYAVPAIAHQGLSTGVAGAVGTLAVFASGLVLGHFLRRRP